MVADVDTETGGVETAFPPVRIDKRFVIQQQGRDFVLSDGLLDGLHQLSQGYFDLQTRLEQLPADANGQVAVCSAKVTVFAPDDGRVLRVATGLGDASPQSVNRMIAPHLIRMAETRAVSRALRSLLNVGMVAMDELGPQGAEPAGDERTSAPAPKAPPAPTWGQPAPAPVATEHILIAGKPYSRAEVLAIYAKRLEEAKAAGLGLGEVDVVPPERAPLAALVAKSQELKRRLEARASAK